MRITLIRQIMITMQIQTDGQTIATDHYSLKIDHYSSTCVNSFQNRIQDSPNRYGQRQMIQDLDIDRDRRLLLFKITVEDPTDRITFYCARFYQQINQSSLYLTQVTFEDLPWFTSSINRETLKTEDRFNSQVQTFRFKFLVTILRSKIALPLPQKDSCNPSPLVIL